VRFVGVLCPAEIAALMSQVRGFVQHSLVAPDGDSEGSPVAVMEAQLSGLPVVATRHAGIPEVVIDGTTGLLVEEGDVPGMAEAMAQLVRDPQIAGKLGAAGQARMRGHFTVDHHLAAVSALLHRVAQQAAPSP
jgi:glycosyltransferase involved in cell wall biosynthesis